MRQRSIDLRESGLLWLINRVVFHPRGYALALDLDSGEFSLLGDGHEVWRYNLSEGVEDEMLTKIKGMMP